jgi:hypothetical protein
MQLTSSDCDSQHIKAQRRGHIRRIIRRDCGFTDVAAAAGVFFRPLQRFSSFNKHRHTANRIYICTHCEALWIRPKTSPMTFEFQGFYSFRRKYIAVLFIYPLQKHRSKPVRLFYKQARRKQECSHSLTSNSHLPEGIALVEFCANPNWVQIWSNS